MYFSLIFRNTRVDRAQGLKLGGSDVGPFNFFPLSRGVYRGKAITLGKVHFEF